QDFFDELHTDVFCRIPSIHEGMEANLELRMFPQDTQNFFQVINVRVDSTIGEKTHEVNSLRPRFCFLDEFLKSWHGLQALIGDGLVDSNEVLTTRSPCPKIQVSHFGVTCHSFGKAN